MIQTVMNKKSQIVIQSVKRATTKIWKVKATSYNRTNKTRLCINKTTTVNQKFTTRQLKNQFTTRKKLQYKVFMPSLKKLKKTNLMKKRRRRRVVKKLLMFPIKFANLTM